MSGFQFEPGIVTPADLLVSLNHVLQWISFLLSMNRRDLVTSLGAAVLCSPQPSLPANQSAPLSTQDLPVEQYQPRSMLHVKETHVARAAFPLIDIHTHITHAGGLNGPGTLRFAATPEECLAVMDRAALRQRCCWL